MLETSETLWSAIVESAGDKLVFPQALRTLIEIAVPGHADALHEIAFKAKFLVKTWNVMRRLGAEDPAREQLKAVFQTELEAVREKLSNLASRLSPVAANEFTLQFLDLTPTAFANILALLKDLSWVKNVEIDRR